MVKEVQPRSISLKEYVYGVAVANAPAWILNTYRDIIIAQLSLIFHLLFLGLTTLAGAFLAGYLIARKTGQTNQKVGVTIGGLSYIAYVALSFILGFRGIDFEDPVTVLGFVAGAILGVKYLEFQQRPAEDSKEETPP